MKRTLFFLTSLLTIPLACQRDQIQPQSDLTEAPPACLCRRPPCRIVKTTFKMTMGDTYHYDQQGSSSAANHARQTLESFLPLEDDPYGVGITDFEYECPK